MQSKNFKGTPMKIDTPVGMTPNPDPINFQPKPVKTAEPPPVNPTPSSSVQISAQLQALGALSADTAVFNAEKVNKIKAAIAEGRFQVNASVVAEGMITTARDLIVAAGNLTVISDSQDAKSRSDSIVSADSLIVDAASLRAKAKDLTQPR
jgi:negative regulator of flagellin synthesis FlgM